MTANSAVVLGPKTIETTVKIISNVTDQDFRSTKRALWLVASMSRGPQLLPAPDVLLRLLQEKSKYITKHLMSGPSGN